MNFKKIIWSNSKQKSEKDTLYLSIDDINHLERIWTKYKIIPQSIDEVQINFIVDRHKLIRFIIKELDILLVVGGKFLITSTHNSFHGNFIRSLDQIKYEFSVSTNGRYNMLQQKINKRQNNLVYTKQKNTLLLTDSIDKWSFGIITNGKKNKQVEDLIDSIVSQNIPNYEIIICGDFKSDNQHIVLIDDVKIENEIRGPITIKKNKIVQQAKYENLMLLHDRYLLPNDWFQRMKNYGNYFDLLAIPNIGPNGGRVNDWGEHNGKPSQIYRETSHVLPYNTWSDGWYSQGGLLVIKKNLYNLIKLDNRLFWGELEDIQFSQLANLNGLFYYIDVQNKIFTFSERLIEFKKINKFSYFKKHVYYYIVKIKNMAIHYLNSYDK
jgi:hypothetical protein